MRPPQRKKRNIEGLCDQPGSSPSSQKYEQTQPPSLGGHNAANGDFSQPLGHNADGNPMDAGTGLSLGSPKPNPVEDDCLADAEEISEPEDFCCETLEPTTLYPVADDSDDPDWLPRGMQKKEKRKTDEPMSEFLSF